MRGAWLVALLALSGAAPAQAQVGTPPGAVVGTVLDAASTLPLAGAVVALGPDPAGAFVPAAGRAAFWSADRVAVTDAEGTYRFDRLAAGGYRLMVRRIGYQPALLAVELRGQGSLSVSVGLMVQPILLHPESVRGSQVGFLQSVTALDETRGARLDAELFRQRQFPATDARLLTRSDLVEAVTLGEQDLFRAFQRLPGVTTRDDYTAELWTRGAPWSHTRVYFDGLPLFNPVHTAGVFSGFNPDALGSVFFFPGVRSASLGEGAAGVLDIGSRRGEAGFGGSAGLSVVAGRVSGAAGWGPRGGWMLAARRSYVDLLTDAFADSSSAAPYAFSDLTARVDLPLGPAMALEASGLWEQDDVRGTVKDVLRDTRGHWGNAVGRVSLIAPLGPLFTRSTIGVSRFDGHLRVEALRAPSGGELAVPDHYPTDNALTYLTLQTQVGPADERWSLGGQLLVQRQSYFGPLPRPYPQAVLLDSLRMADARHRGSAWGELRLQPGPVRLVAGLRVEAAPGVLNAGAAALGPRLSARLALGKRAALSAGVGRSYQYSQAVAPAGPGIGPDLYLTDVWLLAGDTIPAIRADVATAGAEVWMGGAWLASLNLFARRSTGVVEPDPRPGAFTSSRPVFVPGVNRAVGLEASARRVVGRWTASLAYSTGVSRSEAAGLSYYAGADRRHVFDATAMVRPTASWRLGAAVAVASGAPYTRFLLGTVACDSIVGGCASGDTVVTTRSIGDPQAQRTAPYVAADLLADWQHRFGRWDLGLSLQLHNAIGRRNWVTYVGSYSDCVASQPGWRQAGPGLCDRFKGGLPLLPLLEVRAGF